jgi:hypothetical protein
MRRRSQHRRRRERRIRLEKRRGGGANLGLRRKEVVFVGGGEVVVEEERASFVVVEGKDKGVVNYGLSVEKKKGICRRRERKWVFCLWREKMVVVVVVVVKKKKSGGMWKGVNKQQPLFLDSCCEEIHLFGCLYEIIVPLVCSISAFFIYLFRHKFLQ